MNSYLISQGLFLKSIALIYFIAFLSLKIQVLGLFGSNGIQPIKSYLDFLKTRYNKKNIYYLLPTVFWIDASDRTLNLACWTGMIFSFLAICGVYPAIFLFLLWILYSSFCNVGSPFLNYQWDVLLLEVGLLSAFFAIQTPPPELFVYLLWFVFFRFMFSSGITKLVYGSSEWRDLTALDYHYETQPLPTKLAYYTHKWPKFIERLCVIGVHFFEIIVPLFIFSPPTTRIAVFFLSIFFQMLIMLTGNYAFFNLLTMAMCLPLLPDSYLHFFEPIASFSPLIGENVFGEWILNGVAVFFLIINSLELSTLFINTKELESLILPWRRYNLINPYGLFVHMTTHRNEIIVEGSMDGIEWKTYEFKWKPGNQAVAPSYVAPHQPRLDWQMWFAALGNYEQNPWLGNFLVRLLQGSEEVVKLLKSNPFPNSSPLYIRCKIYRYHFTTCKKMKETGAWWTKELLGNYTKTISCHISEEVIFRGNNACFKEYMYETFALQIGKYKKTIC